MTVLASSSRTLSALDLITQALIECGVIAANETPSPEDSALGLQALMDMLDGWNTQNLTISSTYDATFTFTPNQAIYAVGPNGDWVAARPESIVSLYVKYQGVDFPIQLIDQETYNLIPIKTQPGILPQVVLFNATFPNATMTFWPVPNQQVSLIYSTNQLLPSTLTLQTTLSFPPGYYRAARLNLAVEISGRYGRTLPPQTMKLAATSLGDIRRANKRTPLSRADEAILNSGSSFTRIIAGY